MLHRVLIKFRYLMQRPTCAHWQVANGISIFELFGDLPDVFIFLTVFWWPAKHKRNTSPSSPGIFVLLSRQLQASTQEVPFFPTRAAMPCHLKPSLAQSTHRGQQKPPTPFRVGPVARSLIKSRNCHPELSMMISSQGITTQPSRQIQCRRPCIQLLS